jgi:hypothetical protein
MRAACMHRVCHEEVRYKCSGAPTFPVYSAPYDRAHAAHIIDVYVLLENSESPVDMAMCDSLVSVQFMLLFVSANL